MTITHVWVVEAQRNGKWQYAISYRTRNGARLYQKFHHEPGESRIRKYVPA